MFTRESIILTTNLPFEGWGKVFGHNVIAPAVLDRLLHYSHVFLATDSSYPIKGKLSPSLDEGNVLEHGVT